MNKNKLIKILKNKTVITGIVCFIAGGVVLCGTGIEQSEYDKVVTNNKGLEKNITELNTQVSILTKEKTRLEEKVKQAEPFFTMNELEKEEIAKKNEAKIKEEEEKRLEESKITLSNGNFVSGTDFNAGTYDIVAISGSGNVSSSNMFSGGINALMGTNNSDFYEKEYKNIKLPTGTTLKVDGVKIQLIPKS